MRTRNPSPAHAEGIVRGHTGRRSGSAGILVSDGAVDYGPVERLTILGAQIVDGEDDVVVTVGQSNLFVPYAAITAIKDAANPTFDFAAYPENVTKVGSTYYCPYTVTDTNDIRLATATDRDGPWTSGSVILAHASVTWAVGAAGLYAPEIVEQSGVFYLFYSAIVAGGARDARNAIGLATASAITGTYTDTGSAVLDIGAASSPTGRRVGEPSVIYHGGQWIMAFMGEDDDVPYAESEKVFIATAPVATGPWTVANSGNPVIDFGAAATWDDSLVADPSLIYADGYYWIMYAGAPDSTSSTKLEQGLAYATSPTGTWTKYQGNPIISPGDAGTWDDVYVWRGGLYVEDGAWGGVYAAFDGTNIKGGNFRLTLVSSGEVVDPVASDIGITDVGGYFAGTEVESALQEIGADLATVVSASGAVGELLLSDAASTPPVFGDILTNEAETDLMYGDVA